MTGSEHYLEAEKHLRWSAEVVNDGDEGMAGASAWHQAQAQVHATLALTAATALAGFTETGLPQPDRLDWYRAASGGPAYNRRVREAEEAEPWEFAEASEA